MAKLTQHLLTRRPNKFRKETSANYLSERTHRRPRSGPNVGIGPEQHNISRRRIDMRVYFETNKTDPKETKRAAWICGLVGVALIAVVLLQGV